VTSLTFHAAGTPGAQGSKRHVGNGRLIESSKKVKPWRASVEAAARTAAHLTGWPTATGPVRVRVRFRIARPAAHYRTGRNAHLLRAGAPAFPVQHQHGDVDKLQRSTFDALTAAGVIADDKLVVSVDAWKVWASEAEGAVGASIRVSTIDPAS